MTKIFISYRRKDNPFAARSVYEALCVEFGKENVFYDVERMRAGQDFRKQINEMLTWCDVMLVVIGDKWLQSDESGRPRLENPEDSLRIEVSTALNRNIKVIPVLIGDAPSLTKIEASLPKDVKPLIYRHYIVVKPGEDFKAHIDKLIRQISTETTKQEDDEKIPQPSDDTPNTVSEDEVTPKQAGSLNKAVVTKFFAWFVSIGLVFGLGSFTWMGIAATFCSPDLYLFEPEIDDLKVEINGVVHTSWWCTDVDRIEWDWGDKTPYEGGFPASHQYGEPGEYEIIVTAHDKFSNSNTQSTPIAIIEPEPVEEAKVETPYEGIKVTSEPRGAYIFIDGALVGITPASLKSFERGRTATIRLKLDGYEPIEKVVTAPHKGLGEVSFTLQKIIQKYPLTINPEVKFQNEDDAVNPVIKLNNKLRTGSASERISAASDLGEYGRPGVAALADALKDSDLRVVSAALNSLENIGRSANEACSAIEKLSIEIGPRLDTPRKGGEIMIDGEYGPLRVAEGVLAAGLAIGCY